MIDATEGVTEQDTKVAGLAHEAGKASIIVVNKWDLVEKDDKTMDKMRQKVRQDLAFMSYAPLLFISAKTGPVSYTHLNQLLPSSGTTKARSGLLSRMVR